MGLRERAAGFYGGQERWQSAKRVRAVVSADGLAFTLKRRNPFVHALFEAEVHRPAARITPIGREDGTSGVLEGADVRLERSGHTIAARTDARSCFGLNRRLLYWDDLDMAYFACYATWNYLTLPALLLNSAIEWKEQIPGRLDAVFPASIPTHSRKQSFFFDGEGRLLQHNYCADIISGLANAANVVRAHATGSVPYTSHRVVTPQGFGGRPLSGPVLIDLHIHEFSLD